MHGRGLLVDVIGIRIVGRFVCAILDLEKLELTLRLLLNGSALGLLLFLELLGFDTLSADAVPLLVMPVERPTSPSVARHIMAEKMPAPRLGNLMSPRQ